MMVGISKHFDAYTLRARVVSSLMAGLPSLAFLFLIIPWDHFSMSQAVSAAMAIVLLIAFADLAKHLGKKVEVKLGTRATLELWFRDHSAIDSIFPATGTGSWPCCKREEGRPRHRRQRKPE